MAAEFQIALDAFIGDLSPAELRSVSQSKPPTPGDVIKFTQMVDKYESKGKFRALAHRFEPILEGIQQFTNVIDTFIQGGPDMAAFLWGGIKFVLILLLNFTDYFEKISNMYLNLGNICTRLASFQTVFASSSGVQDAVFAFCATVVEFCHRTLLFLKSSSIKQIAKAALRPFKSEFRDIEGQLLLQRDVINMEVQLASEKAAQEERKEAQAERQAAQTERDTAKSEREAALVERRKAQVYRQQGRLHRDGAKAHRLYEIQQFEELNSQLDKFQQKTKWETLLERICSHDHTSEFLRVREKREGDDAPAGWFFNAMQFRQWLNKADINLLWCHAGSGKSVLATSILDHLYSRHLPGTYICYFFCTFAIKETLQIRTILESLIKQVLLPTHGLIPEAVKDTLIKTYTVAIQKPLLREAEKLLLQLLQLDMVKSAYIVVDGIDECPWQIQRSLLSIFKRIVSASPNLKLFLSSRADLDVLRVLSDAKVLNLNEIVSRTDIQYFIKRRLREKIDSEEIIPLDEDVIDEIETQLTKHANGMFLWVDLQINDICRQLTPSDIKKVLKGLPKDLDKTFERILQRIIDERLAPMAVKIFKWLSCAMRPLTLDELAEAVALEVDYKNYYQLLEQVPVDKQKMIHNCGNLVVLREWENTVHFAHFTVKEYLDRRSLKIKESSDTRLFLLDLEDVHQELAFCSMAYLKFSDFERQVAVRKGISDRRAIATIGASLGNFDSTWLPVMLSAGNNLGWMWQMAANTYSFVAGNADEGEVNFTSALPKEETKPADESKILSQYILLEYISKNWIFHCRNIPPGTKWEASFRSLLFGPGPPIPFQPWTINADKPRPGELPEIQVFRWAIEMEHIQLINYLESNYSTVGLLMTEFKLPNEDWVSTFARVCEMRSVPLLVAFKDRWFNNSRHPSWQKSSTQYFEASLLSKEFAFADAMLASGGPEIQRYLTSNASSVSEASRELCSEVLASPERLPDLFQFLKECMLSKVIQDEDVVFESFLEHAADSRDIIPFNRLLKEKPYQRTFSPPSLTKILLRLFQRVQSPVCTQDERIARDLLKHGADLHSALQGLDEKHPGSSGIMRAVPWTGLATALKLTHPSGRFSEIEFSLNTLAYRNGLAWQGVGGIVTPKSRERSHPVMGPLAYSGPSQLLYAFEIRELRIFLFNILHKMVEVFVELDIELDIEALPFDEKKVIAILLTAIGDSSQENSNELSMIKLALDLQVSDDVVRCLLKLGVNWASLSKYLENSHSWGRFEVYLKSGLQMAKLDPIHFVEGRPFLHKAIDLCTAANTYVWHDPSKFLEIFGYRFPQALMDLRDARGRSAFLYATHLLLLDRFGSCGRRKHLNSSFVLKLLLCGGGSDVNAQDCNGETALIAVLKFCQFNGEMTSMTEQSQSDRDFFIQDLYLTHNASISIRDKDGKSAQDYAPPGFFEDVKNRELRWQGSLIRRI